MPTSKLGLHFSSLHIAYKMLLQLHFRSSKLLLAEEGRTVRTWLERGCPGSHSVSTAFKLPESDFFASYRENIYIPCTVSDLSPHTQHWATSFPTQKQSAPKVKVKVAQSFATPWITVHRILQARILEWVAFPSPGDLPNPWIEPRSPTLQVDSLPAELLGSPESVLRAA